MGNTNLLPPAFSDTGHIRPAKEPCRRCAEIAVQLAPKDTGLFHALLESHGHMACLTVIDPKKALLRLTFSPESERSVRQILETMAQTVPFQSKAAPSRGE